MDASRSGNLPFLTGLAFTTQENLGGMSSNGKDLGGHRWPPGGKIAAPIKNAQK